MMMMMMLTIIIFIITTFIINNISTATFSRTGDNRPLPLSIQQSKNLSNGHPAFLYPGG
jgi:hypothetical protein